LKQKSCGSASLTKALRKSLKKALRKSLKQKSCGSDSLTNFAHTANYYRHGLPHPAKENPPSNPMSLEEATDLITGMVCSIMSELAP
jgi:hypothetical protein